MEVVVTLVKSKKFVNRGFLIGPICPIYGYGVLGILLLIGSNNKDILTVFLKSIFICSIIEYMTSYFMEKIFSARWWDYTNKKFNINGRICLETMLPFGILGTCCYYILNPFFLKFLYLINPKIRIILAVGLLVGYIVDNVISFNVMNKIKKNIKKQTKDNTEEIRASVINWIEQNSLLYKHIKKAYPNFKIRKVNYKK